MNSKLKTYSGLLILFSTLLASSCSSMKYMKTVDSVEIPRFMGKWYVIAGRVTSFEKDAYNPTETYTWNEKEKRIDVDFRYQKEKFGGEEKAVPQKAWIENETTHAHWKVQPFWPLKFNYLIIGLASDYEWTAIGVPNGDYLWIMARHAHLPAGELEKIISTVSQTGYPVGDLKVMPQQ